MPLRTNSRSYNEDELKELKKYNQAVPGYIWLGLGLVFGFAILVNLIQTITSLIRRRRAAVYAGSLQYPPKRRRPSDAIMWSCLFEAAQALVRRHIGKKVPVLSKIHISNVGQLSVITSALIIVLAIVPFGGKFDIDWIAHHSARTMYAFMPLIIGLAGKNNLIQLVTGFSYEGLNLFHRWAGRLVLALAAVHIVGRVYVNVPNIQLGSAGLIITNPENPEAVAGDHIAMVKWGLGGVACFILVNITGVRWFRSRFFSAFIFIHVVSVLVMLACLMKHYPALARYLYVGLALYLCDHFWRAGRILFYFGIRGFVRKSEQRTAWVDALTEDTMRVTVRTKMTWIAGSHCYLHLPFLSAGGHPFSIASIPHPLTQLDNSAPSESQIELIIRVRGGLTKRLYAVATGEADVALQPNGKELKPIEDSKYPSHEIYAWAEGCYGTTRLLGEDAETVLLFAGGSGVSFTLSVMMELVRRARALALGRPNMAVCTQRLLFVWVIKKAEHIEWLDGKLQEAVALAPPGLLNIKIYVTQMGKDLPKARMSRQILPEEMYKNMMNTREKEKTSSLPAQPAQAFSPRLSPSTKGSIMTYQSEAYPPSPSPGGRRPEMESKSFRSRPHASRSQTDTPHSASADPVTSLEICPGRPNLAQIIEEEIEMSAISDHVVAGFCGPGPMAADLTSVVSKATDPGKVLHGEVRRNVKLYLEEFD